MLCIPDSLSLIYEGKKVYENPLLCQTYLNDAKSAPFVARNEETKCPCFYFDREWRSSLVTVFYAPINVKLLVGGRPGIGRAFELS